MRAHEVAAFVDAGLRRAEAGRPAAVVIAGVAGVGKSTLLAAAVRRARERARPFVVVTAEGVEGDAPPFGVLARWGVRPRRTLAEGELDPYVAAQDLRDLLDGVGADGPVLLVLDDAQWADRESLAATTWFLRRAAGESVLVLLTVREGAGPVPLLPGVADVVDLRLTGLGEEQAAHLVRATWSDVPDATARRLWEHTDGNPLYLTALLRENAPRTLDGVQELPPPEQFRLDVVGRLERLPVAARRLVDVVAVLGSSWVSLHDATMLSGVGADAADAAADAEVLVRGERDGGPVVRFDHALTRAAVYGELAPARRRALHAAAVQVAGGRSEVFRHRLAAAGGHDERLAAELEAAAAEHHARRAFRLAADHLAAAAVVSGTSAARHRRELDGLFERLLDGDVGVVDAAMPRVRDAHDVVRRTLVEGAWHALQARVREGVAVLAAADSLPVDSPSDGSGDALARYRLDVLLAWGRTQLGHDTPLIARALQRAAATGVSDPALLSHALMARGHVEGGGEAWAAFLAGLEDLPTVPAAVPVELTGLLVWRGADRAFRGHLDAATADLGEVHHRTHDGRVDMLGNGFDSMLAAAHWLAGRWDLAEVYVRLASDVPPASVGLLTHALAGLPPSGRGRFDEADAQLDHAAEVLDVRPWPEAVEAYLLTCVVRAQTAPAAQRARLLPDLRRRWPHVRLGGGFLDGLWSVFLAQAQVWCDELGPADESLDRAAALPRPASGLHAAVAWGRGLVARARGDHDEALDAFTRAAAHDASAVPYLRALLLVDGAEAARRVGSDVDPGPALSEARRLFTRLGAAAHLALLPASAPVTAPVDGVALTAREHDVLALVVAGFSYAQIAAELFISQSTVGYHLGNVYDKTGIRSRHRLTEWVRRHPGGLDVAGP